MVIGNITLMTFRNFWWSLERLPPVDCLLMHPQGQRNAAGRITTCFHTFPHRMRVSSGQTCLRDVPWFQGQKGHTERTEPPASKGRLSGPWSP